MRTTLVGLLAASSLPFAAAPAFADSGVKVGTLTCEVGSGWGFIIGSSRPLRCNFSGNGFPSRFTGSISKFGVDIGYVHSGTIVWGVFTPTDHMSPTDLAGHYGGVTASATVGVGLGANALVGGNGHAVSLQPLSISGSTGLNVGAGIGALDLRFIPPDAPPPSDASAPAYAPAPSDASAPAYAPQPPEAAPPSDVPAPPNAPPPPPSNRG